MDKYLKIFKNTGALLEGHFLLTSGQHSATYFQCAKVLQYPEYLTLFAKIIVEHFKKVKIDAVISPAVGGIVIGTEVGRQLEVRTIFAERQDGKLSLRRGFEINRNEKILVIEDVITTGGSVLEVMEIVRLHKGIVVGVGSVVDRSGGKVHLHENQFSVTRHSSVSYQTDEVPAELMKVPIQKPGSRSLK